MVRHLSLTGGLPLTSSVSLHAASASLSASDCPAAVAVSEQDGVGDTTSKVEKAASASEARVEVASSDAQIDGNLQEQATETSERKTLLIR